jgi:integrase/recombinase XerC
MNSSIAPFSSNQLAPNAVSLPSIFSPVAATARRVLEFFTVNIRNPHTRKAYGKAAGEFAAWCEAHGITQMASKPPGRNLEQLRRGRAVHQPQTGKEIHEP